MTDPVETQAMSLGAKINIQEYDTKGSIPKAEPDLEPVVQATPADSDCDAIRPFVEPDAPAAGTAEAVPTAETAPPAPQKKKCCKKANRLFILSVMMGQLMSFLSVVPGVFTSLNTHAGVNIPMFQGLVINAAFCFIFVIPKVHRFLVHRKIDLLWFFLVGTLDTIRGIMDNEAYHLTSVLSVNILYKAQIPFGMFFAWAIRRHTYSVWQVLMGLLCVGASVVYIVIDAGTRVEGNATFLGCMLVFTSTLIVGLTSVLNEFITQDYTPSQWLARIAVPSVVVSLIIFLAMELQVDVQNGYLVMPLVWARLVGRVIADIILNWVIGWVIGHGGAVLFNVSFVTNVIYSFIFTVFLFHAHLKPLIAVPCVLIVASLTAFFTVPGSKYCCNIRLKAPRAQKEPRRPPKRPLQAPLQAPLSDVSSRQPFEESSSVQLKTPMDVSSNLNEL